MSIFVLLAAVWVALVLSNVADGLSVWGWLRLPHWTIWAGTVAFLAWCMDTNDASTD